MSRVIKFRAWEYEFHPEHPNPIPKMVHWDYLKTWEFEAWKSGMHIMQFTGLHDKNGKEIYEGDIILKEGNPEYVKPEYIRQIFVVTWGESQARFYAKVYLPYPCKEKLSHLIYQCEVIGNIYEHPNLLEAKP